MCGEYRRCSRQTSECGQLKCLLVCCAQPYIRGQDPHAPNTMHNTWCQCQVCQHICHHKTVAALALNASACLYTIR
jgi:hypothetical protein